MSCEKSKPSGTTKWSIRFCPTSGSVGHHVDAVRGELLAIADTRQHQKLRAVDGTAGQYHLTTSPHHATLAELVELDADRAPSVHITRVAVASVSSVRLGLRSAGLR